MRTLLGVGGVHLNSVKLLGSGLGKVKLLGMVPPRDSLFVGNTSVNAALYYAALRP